MSCLSVQSALINLLSGQVMHIHTHTQQTRVVARDNLGRTFSIPKDYSMKFQLVKSRGKGTLTQRYSLNKALVTELE